jgi:hypothetical protein
LFGNWIGKFISVDANEYGTAWAWGEELRIRVQIKVDKPLVRGVLFVLRTHKKPCVSNWIEEEP